MARVEEIPGGGDQAIFEASYRAVSTIADRIAVDARPMTKSRTTRNMGIAEYYYSKPDGLLRASIFARTVIEAGVPLGKVFAQIPLGYFRNIGGRGTAAYGGTRGNNPAIGEALLMQVGRPI